MTDLPEPLVPAHVDLRGDPRVKFDFERLLLSDTWAISTGAEFKAAFLLWCRAWREVPAASLPNDETALAFWSGAGNKWAQVRAVAMRGFVLCRDGRLYHRFLSIVALDAQREIDRIARDSARSRARSAKRRALIGSESAWETLKGQVFRRDNFTCVYCSSTAQPLHCDHVFPISRGGLTELSNLATACARCNMAKGNKTLQEWINGR